MPRTTRRSRGRRSRLVRRLDPVGLVLELVPTLLVAGLAGCDTAGPAGPTDPVDPGPPVVATVEVSPSAPALVPGDTVRLEATARAVDGRALESVEIAWASSDTAVAVVQRVGRNVARATVRRAGTARIDATARGRTGHALLTVEEPEPGPGPEPEPGPVARVELSRDTVLLVEGEALTLAATALDADGRVVTGRAVQWLSEDPTVAYVSAGGRITAIRVGATRVRAKVDGTTAHARVEVSADLAADLVYDAFTGAARELFRIDPREVEPAPHRVLPEGEWATDAAPSPDGSMIAFVRPDGFGGAAVFVMARDGTGMRRVSSGAGVDGQPAWSPDGGRIAFQRRLPGQGTDVWTVALDGSDERSLTATHGAANQSSPAWSPRPVDGAYRIAYSHAENGEAHIWTMREDGTDRRRVTTGSVYDDEPAWSPDAQRLAFHRIGELFTVRADGTDLRLLVSLPFGQFAPAWSPDGRHVAFSSRDAGTDQIYTVFADGSGLARRTSGAADKQHPAWLSR